MPTSLTVRLIAAPPPGPCRWHCAGAAPPMPPARPGARPRNRAGHGRRRRRSAWDLWRFWRYAAARRRRKSRCASSCPDPAGVTDPMTGCPWRHRRPAAAPPPTSVIISTGYAQTRHHHRRLMTTRNCSPHLRQSPRPELPPARRRRVGGHRTGPLPTTMTRWQPVRPGTPLTSPILEQPASTPSAANDAMSLCCVCPRQCCHNGYPVHACLPFEATGPGRNPGDSGPRP